MRKSGSYWAVRILISDRATSALCKVEKATFAGDSEAYKIIVEYSPTKIPTSDEESETFHEDLRKAKQ